MVPNKVFQGAAAGCAVITSATAPQRRILGDATVLVPPGDPDALAAALLRLADDGTELTRLRARAAQLTADQFAPAQTVTPLLRRLSSGSRLGQQPPGGPGTPGPAAGVSTTPVAPVRSTAPK